LVLCGLLAEGVACNKAYSGVCLIFIEDPLSTVFV